MPHRNAVRTGSPAPKAAARMSVSLPGTHRDALEQIAIRKKVSLAWVVRDAIDTYLANDAAGQRDQGK